MASPHRLLFVSILFAVLLILPTGGDAAGRKPPILGGWEPIPDPEDAGIQVLAKYAVKQHRRDTGERLTLARVLGGQQQVVAGMNYRLVIGAASGNGVENLYLASVYDRPWDNFRELSGFNLIA